MQQLGEMLAPKQFSAFSGTVEPVKKPSTMIDFYLGGDLRQLLDDARLRPEHYTDRQRLNCVISNIRSIFLVFHQKYND
jgi:hypothetical protein